MVRYLLGAEEQCDTNRFPFILYHWTGMCNTVLSFLDQEQATNWFDDVKSFCNLVAEVNQYVESPQHRVKFFDRIVPDIYSFLKQWGGARVPQDKRFSVGHLPEFPTEIIWTGAD